MPVPLGITVRDSIGSERVRIRGLAPGSELSLGTFGSDGWMVAVDEVDKTFVGAPKDFVGTMRTLVELWSGDGEILDAQIVQLEWRANN